MYLFLCQAVRVHTLSVKRNLSLLQSDAHIKINQIWTQRSYSSPHEAHLKNPRVAFIKKKKNTVKLQRLFFKNHRNCSLRTSYSEHSIAIHSISKKGGLCNRRTGYCPCRDPCPGGEQFLFFYWPLAISPYFTFLFYLSNVYFLKCAW